MTHPASQDGDRLIRAICPDEPLRVVFASLPRTCAEACARHELVGLGAVTLARGLVCGALMATLTKGRERATVQVVGNGPLRGVTVDSNDLGEVRGYLRARPSPRLAVPPGARPVLGDAIGREGQVIVHRDLGMENIYQGVTTLRSGEIDEDLEAYLRESEQMPTALRCAVILDDQGSVTAAAGALVQTLPGGGDAMIAGPAGRLAGGWLEQHLAAGVDPAAHLDVLAGLPTHVLEWRTVRFHCPCDPDRVEGALRTLEAMDLEELLGQAEPVEVRCEFCGQTHVIPRERLASLLAAKRTGGTVPSA
jgi:molecular chaperone Hsp33